MAERERTSAFSADTARAAGQKSGAARRARKDPDSAAKLALLAGASSAADLLVAIAAGTDGYEDVKPELRFKAASIILEYVLGKPRGLTEEKPEEDPATFEHLFAAAPPTRSSDPA